MLAMEPLVPADSALATVQSATSLWLVKRVEQSISLIPATRTGALLASPTALFAVTHKHAQTATQAIS